jgi:type IV pilus assembly protein PilB
MYKHASREDMAQQPSDPVQLAPETPAVKFAKAPASPAPAAPMAQWVKKMCGKSLSAQLTAASAVEDTQVPQPEVAAPAEAPSAASVEPAAPAREAAAKPEPEMASQIVDAVLRDALNRKARKILLELKGTSLSLALGIDGRLHEKRNFQTRLPSGLGPKVLQAFEKLSSRSEADFVKRSASPKLDGNKLSLELWSYPTSLGRRLVVRLAESDGRHPALGELGMSAEDELSLARAMRQAGGGMILVAGPPGCGKTSTIQALADEACILKSDAAAVCYPGRRSVSGPITVLTGKTGGMTAGEIIASLAQQGSDTLIIPDIRDDSCCRHAISAAASGTRIIAGLDCLSFSEAMSILLDRGLGGWPTATAPMMVVSQRLVRRLCQCKVRVPPDNRTAALLGLSAGEIELRVYQPVGCNRCGGIGYSGRSAIFAIVEVDESMRAVIRAGDAVAIHRHAAAKFGSRIRQRALQAAQQGLTSLEELLSCLPLE